jgi:hypothetical protein
MCARTIHGLLYTALKSLIDMDPDLYNKCEQEYEQSCLNRQHESQERQHRWKLIQQKALQSQLQNQQHYPNDINHHSLQQEEMQLDPSPPTPPTPPVINIPEKIPEVTEPESMTEEQPLPEEEMQVPPVVVAVEEENETSMSVDPAETGQAG